MNDTEARQLVLDILSTIAPEADLAELPGTVSLRDELDLDSMDFLNFIAALHERAKIDIPEAAYSNLSTLDGAVAYLRS